MPRTKPKDIALTRAQAEEKMQRLNEIDAQLFDWALAYHKQLAALKAAHTSSQIKAGRPVLEFERKLILKDLHSWAKKDQLNWKTKTLSFASGKMGIRKGMPKVDLIKKIAKTWDEALILLIDFLPAYKKNVPTINKEKLIANREKIDIEKLLACGLKIGQKKEFWVETEASESFDAAIKDLKNA